jgi:hypothetical protein
VRVSVQALVVNGLPLTVTAQHLLSAAVSAAEEQAAVIAGDRQTCDPSPPNTDPQPSARHKVPGAPVTALAAFAALHRPDTVTTTRSPRSPIGDHSCAEAIQDKPLLVGPPEVDEPQLEHGPAAVGVRHRAWSVAQHVKVVVEEVGVGRGRRSGRHPRECDDRAFAGDTYTVIVRSSTSRRQAQQAARNLRAEGYEAGVLRSTSYSHVRPGYWVAFTGAYPTISEARAHAANVKAAGHADAYVRFVNGAS